VAKGKHGICNIYQSWDEASEFVLGVPGALVQKFNTREEALEFLASHQQVSEGEKSTSTPNNETADVNLIRPSKNQEIVDAKNYRPPMALTGPDPSVKKSDEVFGLDLGSELDLRAALLPRSYQMEFPKDWPMRWST
jgi:hypothetical protein